MSMTDADRSMCCDRECPSRTECLRFMAKPALFQVYADQGRAAGAERCDNFIHVKETGE